MSYKILLLATLLLSVDCGRDRGKKPARRVYPNPYYRNEKRDQGSINRRPVSTPERDLHGGAVAGGSWRAAQKPAIPFIDVETNKEILQPTNVLRHSLLATETQKESGSNQKASAGGSGSVGKWVCTVNVINEG